MSGDSDIRWPPVAPQKVEPDVTDNRPPPRLYFLAWDTKTKQWLLIPEATIEG